MSRKVPSRQWITTPPPRWDSIVVRTLNPSIQSSRPARSGRATRRARRRSRSSSEQAERRTAIRCRSVRRQRSPTSFSGEIPAHSRAPAARRDPTTAARRAGRLAAPNALGIAGVGTTMASSVRHDRVAPSRPCRNPRSLASFPRRPLSRSGVPGILPGGGMPPPRRPDRPRASRLQREAGRGVGMRPILFVVPGLGLRIHSYGVFIFAACASALAMAVWRVAAGEGRARRRLRAGHLAVPRRRDRRPALLLHPAPRGLPSTRATCSGPGRAGTSSTDASWAA